MNDETSGSGSNDRATVALVNSKIDTVLATVEGNARITEAHFETVKARLEAVSGLAGRVEAVELKVTGLTASVSAMERARAYRTTTLPPILISVAALLVTIVAILVAGH